MPRWIAATVIAVSAFLWSGVALAAEYVLVLRDGTRLEVRSEYRIINEVAVFTTAGGRQISIALANIDIAATERVNGQRDGEFRAKAAPPRLIRADGQESRVAQNAHVAAAPPPAKPSPSLRNGRILTNADFGGSVQPVAARSSPKPPQPNVLEKRPQLEPPSPFTDQEAYWRTRARTILTEVYTQQQVIAFLNAQAQALQHKIENQGTTFLLGRDYFGNRVMLPQEILTVEKRELLSINERIREAQMRLTGLYVQYTILQEEARRAGVPPGWLR